MSEERRKDQELRRLRSEVEAQQRDIHDRDDLEHRQDALIARLRDEAAVPKRIFPYGVVRLARAPTRVTLS